MSEDMQMTTNKFVSNTLLRFPVTLLFHLLLLFYRINEKEATISALQLDVKTAKKERKQLEVEIEKLKKKNNVRAYFEVKCEEWKILLKLQFQIN